MMRRNTVLAVVAVLALVVAVAAISATKNPDDTGKGAQPAAAVSGGSQGTRLGSTITPLTVDDVAGRSVTIAKGSPGALFFFAGWCGSCRAEASAWGTLKRELGTRLTITAISPDPTDSIAAINRFKGTIGDPDYPFVWNSTGSLGTRFAVRALDTTIIYDRNGRVVFRDAAPTDLKTLRAALQRAGV
jgi:thiol-disulfide isomerase/thioredoxin